MLCHQSLTEGIRFWHFFWQVLPFVGLNLSLHPFFPTCATTENRPIRVWKLEMQGTTNVAAVVPAGFISWQLAKTQSKSVGTRIGRQKGGKTKVKLTFFCLIKWIYVAPCISSAFFVFSATSCTAAEKRGSNHLLRQWPWTRWAQGQGSLSPTGTVFLWSRKSSWCIVSRYGGLGECV